MSVIFIKDKVSIFEFAYAFISILLASSMFWFPWIANAYLDMTQDGSASQKTINYGDGLAILFYLFIIAAVFFIIQFVVLFLPKKITKLFILIVFLFSLSVFTLIVLYKTKADLDSHIEIISQPRIF